MNTRNDCKPEYACKPPRVSTNRLVDISKLEDRMSGLLGSVLGSVKHGLSDIGGLVRGFGHGASDSLKATVNGLGHLAEDGYKVATDSHYREQAWNSALSDAKAAKNFVVTAGTDPGKAADEISHTASYAWHALETAYNEAAAHGHGSEFIGQIFGQVAILVGTAAIPGGAEVDAVGAIGNASRATAFLGDAGKLVDATKMATITGDVSRATAITGDVSKAGTSMILSAARGVAGAERTVPLGARGAFSTREFDPALAGGPLRELSADRILITERGVAVVEEHAARFGPDAANHYMIGRLRGIVNGEISPTAVDRNFYSHELREYVRYRRLGWKSGKPADTNASYNLWNNAHTATLEEYRIIGPNTNSQLYHPEAIKLMGDF
jgi:hypothetical protein